MLQEIVIYGLVVSLALTAAVVVQRWFDRRHADRSERRMTRTLANSRFEEMVALDEEEARRDFPFLAALPPGLITRARAARPDGPWTILVLRPAETPLVGYTLLARRAASWSARAVVVPPGLTPLARGAAPSPDDDPDPRRAEALATDELIAALDDAQAWFLVEGPWRVVGRAVASRDLAEATAAWIPLGERIFPLVTEPDEFAGGLEWYV